MSKKNRVPDTSVASALALFQPMPNVLYSLDAAARLAGVTRRALLIHCRSGLVRPVALPPHGAMAFTEEAIYAVRKIERLRTVHGLDVAWIKVLFGLLNDVERLHAEVRFLRNR